jgi:hypothetical protein
MLVEFLVGQGVEEHLAWDYVLADKAAVIPQVGKTARELLISLGTTWGRDAVDPDVWVKAARATVAKALRTSPLVVFDDLRMPNEAAMIAEMGGVLVHVSNPRVRPSAAAAPMEGRLAAKDADIRVDNSRDLTALQCCAVDIAAYMRARCA